MQPVFQYVQQLRNSGLTILEICELSKRIGLPQHEVTEALFKVFNLPFPPTSATARSKSSAVGSFSLWLSFQYILQFISLYVMAIALGLLLGTFVSYWFPDVVQDIPSFAGTSYDRMQEMYSTIQSSTAALIVSWPLFMFFFYSIKKKEIESPVIRDLASRKILIYLTLVVAFVVMTINLIMVVNNLLVGSITSRFVANSLIILSIAGTIFWYYLGQVRQDRAAQLEKKA